MRRTLSPDVSDASVEQTLVARGISAPRVTLDQIEANIQHVVYFTAADGVAGAGFAVPKEDGLRQVDICVVTLKNGFKLVGVNEGPISPETYDKSIGRAMARNKAVNQMWPLLGYQLAEHLHSGAARKPDLEATAARTHDAWMEQKRLQGVTSRRSETGEELMVPYAQLSEAAKELDRAAVRSIFVAAGWL